MKNEEYDFLFRVVVVGNSGVGKTNLLFRFTKGEFIPDLPSTIGIDFSFRDLKLNNQIVRACIWDTAGQDKFKSITRSYYHGSVVALLVYDITKYETFENLSHWLEEIRQYADEKIVITLVGNKTDLESERAVSTAEAREFAEKNNLSFIETSALDSTNVEIAFINAVTEAYYVHVNKNGLNKLKGQQINPTSYVFAKHEQAEQKGYTEMFKSKCC